MEMGNKEFAEKNAGKYFLYGKMKVRVVGYCTDNTFSIIVSVRANAWDFGWSAQALEDDDVFVIRSKASKYLYVGENDLKRLK